MDAPAFTKIERLAEEATRCRPFGINLTNVRNTVSQVLTEWKASGVFHEYTDHSFAHVISMLETAEWIIPPETQSVMTPGDWLMLTLATYFHDVGLLVTKEEFDLRDRNPEYAAYKNNPILPSDKHAEYLSRLQQISTDEADRIQYQEFVRSSHGKRVRAWVEGGALDDNGATDALRRLVGDVLTPLDYTFRRDLAAVCESHTLGHTDAVANLRVSQPYGGPQETVNLRYIAIILRTIDLVQITNKRAPAVLFQVVNPSNPTSQVEWQKQGAVRTVRPAPARDRDGNVSRDEIPTEIEVHATFKEPAGFFGLTSYLSYARREIASSYNLVQSSRKDVIENYSFPWRDIDDSNIDTDGFMTESFEFSLDQHKILDLLTGHTLYNNSTVVLRELTQNALDAVRLQQFIDPAPATGGVQESAVEVHWKSGTRELIVLDRGTGMSQEVIEKHLLTVGSSRYQDPKFLEDHEGFHSISRFGIGVLSAFMVSDDVEITTCCHEEEKARQIALQSVHGKYLIKLLDKVKDRDALPMYPHGTSVHLTLRPLAQIGDVLEVARSWLMFPRCRVTVHIDDNPPITIGYESPKEAIEEYVDYLRSRRGTGEYKVHEVTDGAVTLAFAVTRTDLFPDWNFVSVQPARRGETDREPPVSTCIEGVAVERSTPGFHGVGILAVANAVGSEAPKTNVARSALEDTAEQRNMLQAVYRIYGDHVSAEIDRLASSESYSLSRAVSLSPYIASSLTSPNVSAAKPDMLKDALANVPLILTEDKDKRANISLSQLSKNDSFATIESPLHRSIEYFVREAPSDITTNKLMGVLGNAAHTAPNKLVVCNIQDYYIDEHVRRTFEISSVTASVEARTLSLTWSKTADPSRWLSSQIVLNDILRSDIQFYHQLSDMFERTRTGYRTSYHGSGMNVPVGSVEVANLEAYGAFAANRDIYLTPGSALVDYFVALNSSKQLDRLHRLAVSFAILDIIRAMSISWDIMTVDLFERALSNLNASSLRQFISRDDILSALRSTKPGTFDSYAWDRRSEQSFF